MTSRIGSLHQRFWSLLVLGVAVTALAAVQLMAAPGAGAARGPVAGSGIQSVGNLDCNGYSPVQHPVKPGGTICAEVHLGPYGHL